MGLFDFLNTNKDQEKDKNKISVEELLYLDEMEREAAKEGEYGPESFEEEDLEDDDYYYEDEDMNNDDNDDDDDEEENDW